MASSSPVWLITGASSGFGRLLIARVLKAGHRAIGTVRSKAGSADATREIEDNGAKLIELDLTDPQEAIVKKVEEAQAIYGQIDYLVNNAGFATAGIVELFTEAEVIRQYRTNVFGALFTIQGALPGMRSRKSGSIVNVTSVGGQVAGPASGIYASSKFALEGISEALSHEVEEFGISVLIIEPGWYRTNFIGAMKMSEKGVTEGYKGSKVENFIQLSSQMNGKQPGDPIKAVERMFQAISGEGPDGHIKGKVLRLTLGMDAFAELDEKHAKLAEDVSASRKLEEASSTAV